MSICPSYARKMDSLRGFTLMETLLVIGLFVLLLAALIGLYLAYGTLFTTQQTLFTLGNSADTAVSDIGQAVRQANRILASDTISGTIYTTGSGTLVLELPSIDSGGAALSGHVDHTVFYSSGTVLYRISDPDPASSRNGGTIQLSDALSNLSFSYDTVDVTTASKVSVSLTLATQTTHTTTQFHLEQDTYLRNK